MEEIMPFTVRLDPNLGEWIQNHSLGNDSAVIRAAIWHLMQAKDPDSVIRAYLKRSLAQTMSKGRRNRRAKGSKAG